MQLLLGNAAIDIWEFSNTYLGMQQSIIDNAANIFGNAAINYQKCSNQ